MSKLLQDCQTIKDVLMLQQLSLLERRMLLEFVFKKPRAWFIAHDDEKLEQATKEQLQTLFERRLAGEPMAYIIGHREFMGLDFKVTPAVLIPRPETELLVNTALEFLEKLQAQGIENPRVLDIGTGSGIVAISIKHYYPKAEVMAIDLSAEALEVAKENAQVLKTSIEFLQSDLFTALDPQQHQFDLVVSNPPYIHREDKHLEQGDVRFEPVMALTDFADGLNLIARLIAEAPMFLKKPAALWMEHGWDQAEMIREMLKQKGFKQVESLKDLAAIERISGGLI
ncbi:MAG TPA: peptide chain release factor N(5)-glutamine methyltransferase [Oligella sp.]|nr:peptide chain release factor N(5)-glutamine methyltransferase [Oligella sp.]